MTKLLEIFHSRFYPGCVLPTKDELMIMLMRYATPNSKHVFHRRLQLLPNNSHAGLNFGAVVRGPVPPDHTDIDNHSL